MTLFLIFVRDCLYRVFAQVQILSLIEIKNCLLFVTILNQALSSIEIESCSRSTSVFKSSAASKTVLFENTFSLARFNARDQNHKTLNRDNIIATQEIILFLPARHFRDNEKWNLNVEQIVVANSCLRKKTLSIVFYKELRNNEKRNKLYIINIFVVN